MKTIKADFFSDWVEIIKNDLLTRGYAVDNTWDKNDISNYYFNLLKRLVEPGKRVVLKSSDFSCPAEHQIGLDLLIEKIKNGDDLTPHLSKLIKNLRYDDDLLNDWGIYHLHLGTEFESDSDFIERTGPLLYARFDQHNAYLINIFNHHSWAKQDIIRIIHNNWPASIESYLLRGIIGLVNPPSDNDIKELRKGHVTSAVEIEPGIVYAPIGGGLMTSGISTEAVRLTQKYHKIVHTIEAHLKKNIDSIIAENKITQFDKVTELEFRLQVINDKFYAVETGTRIAINYGGTR